MMSSLEGSEGLKMYHVNLMQDTVIASLPEEGLRSVIRYMLAVNPTNLKPFEDGTRGYLQRTSGSPPKGLFVVDDKEIAPSKEFHNTQKRIRSMLGCGMVLESVALLANVVSQANEAINQGNLTNEMDRVLKGIDGDVIQAATALKKTLFTLSGSRTLREAERKKLGILLEPLICCKSSVLRRSLLEIQSLLEIAPFSGAQINPAAEKFCIPPIQPGVETFQLGNKTVPRLFSGLWQLSSPSWGATGVEAIHEQFREYATHGFTAYDMADHYGDAEVMFGRFRASCANPSALFGGTKYCIFTPTTVTRGLIRSNVTERCARMSSNHIDLLQFHWQFYEDQHYLDALQFLQEDGRVHHLGLCNFDTQRMKEIANAGIKVVTNQVQFSLVDSRPVFEMAKVCEMHHIHLLTYGTLLGGFIADKWLGRPAPELFSADITPSQRKYCEMIDTWGGWALFQELLQILKDIATKYDVSISNVATRWVLDFPFVGAVLVGARMGVSSHWEDNLRVYGWKLDEKDQEAINSVLAKSRRNKLIELLGDCGGEYR